MKGTQTMDYRAHARNAANIAHRLTYVSGRKTVNGQDSVVLPHDEAMIMVDHLLKISLLLNDIQDGRDRGDEG